MIMHTTILYDPFAAGIAADAAREVAAADQLELEAEAEIANAIKIAMDAFEEAADGKMKGTKSGTLTGPGGLFPRSDVERAKAARS